MYLTLPVVKEEPVLPVQEIEAYYKDKAAKDVVRKTALLVEEMYIYSSRHTKNLDYIDVMITISNTDSRILFRSLGEPFAPMGFASEKERENVLVLKKIASEIKYEYICGMNTTSLRVAV